MILHGYGLINNYLVQEATSKKIRSATLAELKKEHTTIYKILDNADYYYNSTKEKYFKVSLSVYQKALSELKKEKINDPQALLAEIKENHLIYLKESDGRILETIAIFEEQKKELPKFSCFFNQSIVSYKKISRNIQELDSLVSEKQKEQLIKETLNLLIATDKKVSHFCK